MATKKSLKRKRLSEEEEEYEKEDNTVMEKLDKKNSYFSVWRKKRY